MLEMLASGEFDSVQSQHLPLGPFGSVYNGQRWSARYVFPADVARSIGNADSSIWVNALDPITFSFDGGDPVVIDPAFDESTPASHLATNHNAGSDAVMFRFGLPRPDGGLGRLTIAARAAGNSVFGQVSELNSSDLIGLEFSDFSSFEIDAMDIFPTLSFQGTVDTFLIRIDPNSVVPAPAVASLLTLAGLAAVRRRRA